MPQFRKKPVVIEAVQFLGSNTRECCQFMGRECLMGCTPSERIEIKTLEGVMTARPGDWIIRGVKGEIYPCRDDIFQATYDAVKE